MVFLVKETQLYMTKMYWYKLLLYCAFIIFTTVQLNKGRKIVLYTNICHVYLKLQTHLENELQKQKGKVQSLQIDLDNSEAVQRDFVKLSQSLQVHHLQNGSHHWPETKAVSSSLSVVSKLWLYHYWHWISLSRSFQHMHKVKDLWFEWLVSDTIRKDKTGRKWGTVAAWRWYRRLHKL